MNHEFQLTKNNPSFRPMHGFMMMENSKKMEQAGVLLKKSQSEA